MTDPRAWLDEAQRRCEAAGALGSEDILIFALDAITGDLDRALAALRAVLDLCDEQDRSLIDNHTTWKFRQAIEEALNPATLEKTK